MGTNLSKKLYRINECHVAFWCPGCKKLHILGTRPEAPPPSWEWNSDAEKPTFRPSVLVQRPSGAVCHSYITDGKIQFLGDCTHDLVGQTVDLPDIPSNTF